MAGAVPGGRETREWALRFEQHDVLLAPVQDYAALRSDPQMRHMGYFAETDQAPYGRLPMPHVPGTARNGVMPAAPKCGEHSRAILTEFGYGSADIAALVQAGLVVQAS